eukprot:gene18949-26826_t
MLVLSGTLTGTRITVHYTLDNGGQVKDVWLLSTRELANKPWPTSPLHTEAWSFDAGSQTWTKPCRDAARARRYSSRPSAAR